MSNMSYCRFRNTLADLVDCRDALDSAGLSDLSEMEREAAERLIRVCAVIAQDHGEEVGA